MNYYVYYKVDAARLAAVNGTVHQLFAQLRAEFGVQGRWMRRRDDASTYMEVYEDVADAAGFDAALERAAQLFSEARRVERFISAGTPA